MLLRKLILFFIAPFLVILPHFNMTVRIGYKDRSQSCHRRVCYDFCFAVMTEVQHSASVTSEVSNRVKMTRVAISHVHASHQLQAQREKVKSKIEKAKKQGKMEIISSVNR